MKNYLFLALMGFLLFTACKKEEPADMIIYGGPIYTVDKSNEMAEAVAVKGDRIVFVGSLEEAQKMQGTETRMLDLEGKTMTPGWIEGHGHFFGMGQSKLNLDLSQIKNYDEMVAMVKEAAEQAAPGTWILGRGWHQSKWDKEPEEVVLGFQTHTKLSEVSPNNPVWLTHASGHAAFGNAKAMEIGGVTAETPDPEGGEILKNDLGNPTGVFNERAMGLISRHIPYNSEDDDDRAMHLAVKECLENGITTFHDAGSGRKVIDLMKEFVNRGDMKVRLYVMISGRDRDLLEEYYEKGPDIGLGNNHLTVRSIKLNTDGALGSRGAWLLRPYTDRPETAGMATQEMEYVQKVAHEGIQYGFQVCAHAIGDRANKEVLDRFQIAFEANPEKAKDHRYRMEHAQHLAADDIPRFGGLGVIASMQAVHMSSDRPWAITRLGEERIREGAYVWRKLFDTGAVIMNGTDVPVEPINPIASFYASVTRQTLEGFPVGGFEPDQKMTRAEALDSYTLSGAYGGFEEDIKGSIEVGKLADFTIFNQNLMEVPDNEILNTKVMMTIVGGEILFQRD